MTEILWALTAFTMTLICCVGVVMHFRFPRTRPLLVLPVAWAGAGVFYYMLTFGAQLGREQELMWGALHRLVAALLVLLVLIGVYFILEDEDDDQGDDE